MQVATLISLMICCLLFQFLEGYRDAYLWIEVNKTAPVKYTDKPEMHKVMAASRGLVYFILLIVLVNVYDYKSVLLFSLGLWLQHFLIHTGTYFYYVEKSIPGSNSYGFFTDEKPGDKDSFFDKYFAFQRYFLGRAILFIVGSLLILYTIYDILRSGY